MPKFKVHLQQYVERIATVEVEAPDAGMAAQIAKTDLASSATWEDGDDAMSVNVDSISDESGMGIGDKLFRVIIAWNDRDPEEGTYSDTVEAADAEEAEQIVREMMAGDDIYKRKDFRYGRLIECVEVAG